MVENTKPNIRLKDEHLVNLVSRIETFQRKLEFLNYLVRDISDNLTSLEIELIDNDNDKLATCQVQWTFCRKS
ncbi:hypothetical protein V1477_010308 [Vespula maculifrons]|uniref:Uncharacterized protein n=2 Tax=Vespula TaxID=7451 RepID=A0A834KXH4_VESVU|nr:hypothetical protein HZH66_000782 [Vespula vulgaris]